MNDNLCLNYENTPIRVRMTKSGPEFNLCDLEAATGERADRPAQDLSRYIPPQLMKQIFGISVPHLLATDAATHMYKRVEALDPEDKHRWFFAAMMLLTLANTMALEDEDDAES